MEKLPLCSAVIANDKPEVERLLLEGAKPDEPDIIRDNNTAIHLASFNKYPDILAVLLESFGERKADKIAALNRENINGATPLFEAIWIGPTPEDYKRGENGVIPSVTEVAVYTQKYDEALKNMPATVELLLQNGANVTAALNVKPNGNTPVDGKIPVCHSVGEWIKKQMSGPSKNSNEYRVLTASEKLLNEAVAKKKVLNLKTIVER